MQNKGGLILETDIFTQPCMFNGDNYSLGSRLEKLLTSKRPKYINLSLFFGLVKENAYEKLYPFFSDFMANGGKLDFYLAAERKNSSKKIVRSLLELGCNIYAFTISGNDYISDFQYKNIVASSSKKAVILLSSGNFSLSGLYEGHNIVTEFSFNLETEPEEFENFKRKIFPDSAMNSFKKLSLDNFDDFFTSPDKPLPSIEEFTKKDLPSSAEVDTKIDDLSIDIEIDKNIEFLVAKDPEFKNKKEKKNATQVENTSEIIPIEAIEFEETKYYMNDDAIDIESMLFSNPVNSAPAPKKVVIKEEPLPDLSLEQEGEIIETKIISKSANLAQTSIFMFQLPKISGKGIFAGEIKIPVYLRDLIPGFWEWPKEYKLEKNSVEKCRLCKFDIVDTQVPNNCITEENVKLFQREGEKYFTIHSETLSNMNLTENDIVRFIKNQSKSASYYTCEIIRQDADEYPIWEQFCTHLLKGSKRKYGVM